MMVLGDPPPGGDAQHLRYSALTLVDRSSGYRAGFGNGTRGRAHHADFRWRPWGWWRLRRTGTPTERDDSAGADEASRKLARGKHQAKLPEGHCLRQRQ